MEDASTQARKQLYEIFRDADGNGIPDILEGKFRGEDLRNLISSHANTVKVVVDGKEYPNFNELPPEQQQKIERSLEQLTKISTQAGNVMKGFGLFKLIRWFAGRGRERERRTPYRNMSSPASPPPYQMTSSSFFSKGWLFLVAALIIGAIVYYSLP